MEQPKRREDGSSRRPARRVRWKLLPETWNPTAGLTIFSERVCTSRQRGAGRLQGASRRRDARAVHEASEPPTKRAVVGEACAPRQGRPRRALGSSLMMRPRAQRRLPGGSLRSLQNMSREAYATGGVPSKLPKMASIMTRASIGSSETPTTRRAGTQPGKNSA